MLLLLYNRAGASTVERKCITLIQNSSDSFGGVQTVRSNEYTRLRVNKSMRTNITAPPVEPCVTDLGCTYLQECIVVVEESYQRHVHGQVQGSTRPQ